ncbi:hypothetical protein WEB32_02985 [Streptomyces netropsis]|uniref:hypothetical protein n=1 Tax=Streptomyces netropsis TaxID=55404 RepID=UPI0030D277A7
MSKGQQEEQQCPACDGDRVTTKTEWTVEVDRNGHKNSVSHETVSSCSHCHGSGVA